MCVRVDRYSPSRTVRALLADRPTFRHSETLREAAPLDKLKVEGWTVHTPWADRPPFTSCNPPEAKTSLDIFSKDLQTVRTPWEDRPPFTLKSHQRPKTSLVNLLSDLRTVLAPGPDRPQSNLSAQARETTSLDEFFKTPADCPHPRGGSSAVRLQAQTELQPLWTKKNYIGGPSAQQVRTVRPSFLFSIG